LAAKISNVLAAAIEARAHLGDASLQVVPTG